MIKITMGENLASQVLTEKPCFAIWRQNCFSMKNNDNFTESKELVSYSERLVTKAKKATWCYKSNSWRDQ